MGITNGDTFTCLKENKQQIKVRLAQINAPENNQPIGQKSQQLLSDLIFGQLVTLKNMNTDRYGCTLAEIYKDKIHINTRMVYEGLAYTQYQTDQFYTAVQNEARQEKRGLWADSDPIYPRDWHKNKCHNIQKNNINQQTKPQRKTAVESNSETNPIHLKKVANKVIKSRFSCGGKTVCRQMSSCAEAQFYLNQCGLTRLDRDRDGIPCESICDG